MRAIAQVLKPDGQVMPIIGPNWGPEYFLKQGIARAAKASEQEAWNRHAEYVGLSVQECKRRAKLRLEQGQYEFCHMDSEYLHGLEVAALNTGNAAYCRCRGCTWRGWQEPFQRCTWGYPVRHYELIGKCPACGALATVIRQQADFEEAAQ